MFDEAKLHQFVGQMLGDLGGAASVAMVRIGDALGLYKALHAKGPMDSGELAATVGEAASATFANGCRIKLPRTTSPMTRRHGNSAFRPNKAMVLRDRGQPRLHDGRAST